MHVVQHFQFMRVVNKTFVSINTTVFGRKKFLSMLFWFLVVSSNNSKTNHDDDDDDDDDDVDDRSNH